MDSLWTTRAEDAGVVVRLYCPDTKCYLRVNKNGRLFADVPATAQQCGRLPDECDFRLFRVRGSQLAFQSLPHGRFLSRGTAFPRFRFPLQLGDPTCLSAHSCFEQQVRDSESERASARG